MRTYDYRVVRRTATPVTLQTHQLAEVYYDENDNIILWSTEISAGDPEDLADLRDEVDKMRDAFNKPVLLEEALPRGGCFSCVGCKNGACSVG